jgi:hypothetical protein
MALTTLVIINLALGAGLVSGIAFAMWRAIRLSPHQPSPPTELPPVGPSRAPVPQGRRSVQVTHASRRGARERPGART